METRHLTCIQCPRGCQVAVGLEDGRVVSVEGNSCRRGEVYAREEVTHPTRTVTSTVSVRGGRRERVSVKTASPVPKELMRDVMGVVNHTLATAPVHVGDVLVPDVCGTGVALVATANVDAAEGVPVGDGEVPMAGPSR